MEIERGVDIQPFYEKTAQARVHSNIHAVCGQQGAARRGVGWPSECELAWACRLEGTFGGGSPRRQRRPSEHSESSTRAHACTAPASMDAVHRTKCASAPSPGRGRKRECSGRSGCSRASSSYRRHRRSCRHMRVAGDALSRASADRQPRRAASPGLVALTSALRSQQSTWTAGRGMRQPRRGWAAAARAAHLPKAQQHAGAGVEDVHHRGGE